MSLRALRTLAAIAQHGSFARAAEAVCLTQSAVSLHVRTLEEAFNAPLFDRSRRTPTLTEAGRRAVERAREILAIYDGIAGVGDAHLDILARLGEVFGDEELLRRLTTEGDPQVIYEALK